MGLSERQIKAAIYVKEKGKITNKDYQELNLVSKRTASRDLDELVKRNIIDQIGITGKGTEYVLRGHKGAKGVMKGPMTHITAVTGKGYNWANAATR
jgi:predicted HTH transcriptional regulator